MGDSVDLVVIGGGYSGMGTALSAARMGCKVALIQDRAVLGGNGSSEVRVWANGFIRRGVPVEFEVPAKPGPVVSGLRLGNRVLARRTDFGTENEDKLVTLTDGDIVSVDSKTGM